MTMMITLVRSRAVLAVAAILVAVPAVAQDQAAPTTEQPAASVVNSTAGVAGQRQTRNQTTINNKPMARLNNRIANRIYNRLDRNYSPQLDTASSFAAAQNQVTKTNVRAVP